MLCYFALLTLLRAVPCLVTSQKLNASKKFLSTLTANETSLSNCSRDPVLEAFYRTRACGAGHKAPPGPSTWSSCSTQETQAVMRSKPGTSLLGILHVHAEASTSLSAATSSTKGAGPRMLQGPGYQKSKRLSTTKGGPWTRPHSVIDLRSNNGT